MSYETVEAVQCKLRGGPWDGKITLMPSTGNGQAPPVLTEEELYSSDTRFWEEDKASPKSPIWPYKYNLNMRAYVRWGASE